MERYIHLFETEAEFNEARQNNYLEPWVSYTETSERVDYNKPDYTKIPFTIEALGSGNITWALGNKTVQYSKNGSSWETMDSSTTISVVEGDEIQFKGTNTDYCGNTISATSQFNVKGNIMSLTDGDDFETADTVNAYGFHRLFSGCTYLVSACDLKLPVTTLAGNCYQYMFAGCTSLTTAPVLPATELSTNCYGSMFSNCTSLTTAPELPATTLANYCYYYMFYGCTNLTTAPELPATTLVNYCYQHMFKDCTNLNYIKAMFTTTPTYTSTGNWVNGVAATGTFVKNAAASWTTTGVSGIPDGWTVKTAPAQ